MLGAEELLSVDIDGPGELGEEGIHVELGRGERLYEGGHVRNAPLVPR